MAQLFLLLLCLYQSAAHEFSYGSAQGQASNDRSSDVNTIYNIEYEVIISESTSEDLCEGSECTSFTSSDCSDRETALQSDIASLNSKLEDKLYEIDVVETKLKDCNKELNQCNEDKKRFQDEITNQQQKIQNLTEQNDHYLYGKLDAKIEILSVDNQRLKDRVLSLNQNIATLSAEKGGLVQKVSHYEQTEKAQKLEMKTKDDTITAQQNQIQQLQSDRNSIKSNSNLLQQQITSFTAEIKKLKKSALPIHQYGDALTQNEKLKGINGALSVNLTECRFIVEQNESTIKRLELEFGECWVEWGARNMSYEQCEVAVTKLQGELSKERDNFALCKNVNKECKVDKKYLRGNLTERELQLYECHESMTGRIGEVLDEYCILSNTYRPNDKGIIAITMALIVGVISLGAFAWYLWIEMVNDLDDRIRRIRKLEVALKGKEEEISKMEESQKKVMEEMKSAVKRKEEEIKSLKEENEKLKEEKVALKGRMETMEMDNDDEKEVAQLKLENMSLKEEVQRLEQRMKESEHKEKEKKKEKTTAGNDGKEKVKSKKVKKERKRKSNVSSTKTPVKVTSVDAHHPLPTELVLKKEKSMGRLKEAKVVNDGVKKFEGLIHDQHYGRDRKDEQNAEVSDLAESSNNDSNESFEVIEDHESPEKKGKAVE